MLRLFLLSFAVSLGVGYLTVRFEHLHGHFTGDVASRGSHKVHRQSVTRVGGIAIFIGWLAAITAAAWYNRISGDTAFLWLVCLLPAFLGGLTEDLTKKVSPILRLLAAFLSAALAYVLLDAGVSRIGVWGLDALLMIPALSFLFTCFAIGGVAHAINIIDGLNGLASGVCLMALVAISYVAFEVADWEIILMCGIGVGTILGFRVWNYPSGRIFCGDGGAYFLGTYVAVLAALLVHRHPQVSPWFALLLVIYPVWETLFSAYRRRVLRGRPASGADKLHLHTLAYKRIKHPAQGGKARARRNSDASVSMLLFAGGSAIPAVLWWSQGSFLLASACAYIVIYITIYRRLVRFGGRGRRTPRSVALGYVARQVAALNRAAASRRTIREADKTR